MDALILIANRLIKITAHLTKILSYPFHFIFPNTRFTVPSYRSPLLQSKVSKRIPAIIWQTNYTDQVSLPVYLNYLFNRLMAPTFEYRFMITSAREDFIGKNYPGAIFDNYKKLNIGASQADFWRLLVLKKHGGIYMDIDAHFVWPIAAQLKPKDDDLFIKVKENEFSNYFIATRPENPIINKTIEIVLHNIQQGKEKSVYSLTGPTVLNQALIGQTVHYRWYRYLCVQGSFTNEHFQYIDKPKGKWTHAKPEDLLKNEDT